MDALSSQGIGKTSKRYNHQWSPIEDKILIECCLKLVNEGWIKDNGFKPGYTVLLEKWMAEKILGCKIKGDPHIRSRLKTFKKQFREVRVMRSQAASAGFSWDETYKCVTCSDDVWTNWLKTHKDAIGLRSKPFPYYDELSIIFGNDQETGEGAVENIKREETTFAAEKAALEAHHIMLKWIENDRNNVDVELENIHEPVFCFESVNTESSNSTAKRSREQDHSSMHGKKVKGNGSNAESMNEAFMNHVDKVSELCDAIREGVGEMGKYYKHMNAQVENKSLLYDMITNIEGLTVEEGIRAFGKIAADRGKLDSFFVLPSDGAKKIYVKGVLYGYI